jgi:very-short-patch-repair endonuclease
LSGNIIKIAKTLRKRLTDAEQVLWKHLRSKRFSGLKFRRQQPIGNYIVDFVCFERRIVIEVDGGGHAIEKVKDKDDERDQWLKGEGFEVLRFWNNEVLQNIDGVLEVIRGYILSPSPAPSHRGRSRLS